MFRVRQQIGCTDEVVDSCRGRGFSRENAIRVAILDTGIGFLGIDFNWGYVVQTGLVLAAIYIDFLRTRKLSQEAGR